jgi:polygalacturonase
VIKENYIVVTLGLIMSALLFFGSGPGVKPPGNPWSTMDSIVARCKPPIIRPNEFPITNYGAKGDGVSDCSGALRSAIDTATKSGGGVVVVPIGVYCTGPIRLRSNVNLHLDKGAVLKFYRYPAKYLPVVLTRWEGVECLNYSPFIYAHGENNIAITGEGTLDGQADDAHWWPWKGNKASGWAEGTPNQNEGRNKLFEMGEQGTDVVKRLFGEGFFLRPNFIELYRCRNILIEGVRIINSPMWEIHPVLCVNVTVRGVQIDSHGPNNDGCNPESCRDVLIENCSFDTGDDCIAIKSGRNNDGRRINVPSENIVIRKCTFKDGHGGVTIGSEMSGSVRNVFVENCTLESPVLYSALRIKSNAVRGGTVENIFLRDIKVGLVDRAVVDVDLLYEEGRNGKFLPTIRNISIERMTVKKCATALNLVGYDVAPLQNITLKDCTFKEAGKGYKIEHVKGLALVNTRVNGKELKYP